MQSEKVSYIFQWLKIAKYRYLFHILEGVEC